MGGTAHRSALAPFALLYRFGVAVRNLGYNRRLFPTTRLSTPVIAVGNITAGGTGKTPMVELLVRRFTERKISCAVLSRGYRRTTSGTRIVSNGTSVSGPSSETGDEPLQIARNNPGTIVVVDEDRVRGGQFIESEFHPRVIILDDGFQHRRIGRDADIVLVDTRELARGVRMLPAGRHREPLSALRRASVIVLTNCGEEKELAMARIRQVTSVDMVSAATVPSSFLRCRDEAAIGLDLLQPATCVAFCGIAKPENFRAMLAGLGFEVKEFHTFADHHPYAAADLELIGRSFSRSGARWILTTEKDAVRLRDCPMPAVMKGDALHALRVTMVITEGRERFERLLERAAEKTG